MQECQYESHTDLILTKKEFISAQRHLPPLYGNQITQKKMSKILKLLLLNLHNTLFFLAFQNQHSSSNAKEG